MKVSNSSEIALPPPHRILVAIDGSPASQHALAFMHGIVPSNAEILLATVTHHPRTLIRTPLLLGGTHEATREQPLQEASDALDRARQALADLNVTLDAVLIDPAKGGGDIALALALAQAVNAYAADLVVLGSSHRPGLQRSAEGSVCERFAKLTRCPLLIVPASYRQEAAGAPKRILFAIDGSEHALRAARYGIHFATSAAHLRAIYVVDRVVRLTDFVPVHLLAEAFISEANAALAAARSVLSSAPGETTTELVSTKRTADDIAHTIVREAVRWNAELLVMGMHGRRGLARWFVGGVAGRVAPITQMPLLLVGWQKSHASRP
jgi:nucleotide-binding universal stress UspA family protein